MLDIALSLAEKGLLRCRSGCSSTLATAVMLAGDVGHGLVMSTFSTRSTSSRAPGARASRGAGRLARRARHQVGGDDTKGSLEFCNQRLWVPLMRMLGRDEEHMRDHVPRRQRRYER